MNRDHVIRDLKDVLSGNAWHERLGNETQNINLAVWREFDSERDMTRHADIREYVESLLSAAEAETRASGRTR